MQLAIQEPYMLTIQPDDFFISPRRLDENFGTMICFHRRYDLGDEHMSRLGRDYLKVGQCMEILRQKGVRLIAINDNVDSFYKDDDFTPFRNIMNEWYARDTSRKIKSTFKTKGESGKHTGSSPPYGYIKDKDDKNQWIIDEKAAEVVRRIFHLTMDGKGPYAIARILEADKIDIP